MTGLSVGATTLCPKMNDCLVETSADVLPPLKLNVTGEEAAAPAVVPDG